MVAEGRTYFAEHQHVFLFPGLAIVLTVLGLTLLGEGLRDVLDPAGGGGPAGVTRRG